TPARFVFAAQPLGAYVRAALDPAPVLMVQDALGNAVTTANGTVTVALGANPGAATLTGTTTLSLTNGAARFDYLMIDAAGTGYTLTATSAGFTQTTSAPFNGLVITSLAAGASHNCMIASGDVYCWGYNAQGQLGNGTTVNAGKPVRMVSGP